MSSLLEYEKPEFKNLVDSVISLKKEGEQVFYRQPFRWFNEANELQSNCYEMFDAEAVARYKNLQIERMYGDHIFVATQL